MQVIDIQFIEKADGPRLVEGLEQMAKIFNFDLSEFKRKAGFSDSTFNRWLNSKRRPSHNSRMKIKIELGSIFKREEAKERAS